MLSTDPWILQFENFATEQHWEAIETSLGPEAFYNSTVVNPDKNAGTTVCFLFSDFSCCLCFEMLFLLSVSVSVLFLVL